MLSTPLAFCGTGPFKPIIFFRLLLNSLEIAEAAGTPTPEDIPWNSDAPEVVVVGRQGWLDIDKYLPQRAGQRLRVYSQEMCLLWIISGRDPFDQPPQLIRRLAGTHPALSHLESVRAFNWPTTWVPEATSGESDIDPIEIGFLHHAGYKVGKQGLPTSARELVLRRCYLTERVPATFSRQYVDSWGAPGSKKRLSKMAESIAAFSRNAQARRRPPATAIQHWNSDLEWLRRSFYEGTYHFQWPGT